MEFPTFAFGDEESVIRRADAEGEAWLAAWRRTGPQSGLYNAYSLDFEADLAA